MDRKRLAATVIALLILIAMVPALRYRRYVYAIAWHCRHGNYATFAGHRMKLPLFWWEEKDRVRWERYFLKRACAGAVCLEDEIEVTHVVPSQEPSIPGSDATARDQQKQRVALWNERARRRDSSVRFSVSLLELHARSYQLFCMKTALRIEGITAEPSLDCGAARFPYTIMTSSFGPPSRQQDVDSILSTLE